MSKPIKAPAKLGTNQQGASSAWSSPNPEASVKSDINKQGASSVGSSPGVHEIAASEYLSKHKILEFFENLTSALVYEKPEDPRAFAKEFIEKIQASHEHPHFEGAPTFMDDSNIESIFGMLDITKTGFITRQQYLEAMKSMGLKKFNESPSGGDFNKISRLTFMKEAKMAIKNASLYLNNTKTIIS